MPVSTEYIARETAANLWRNRLMTIAAVLTVAVSLSLVGAALLLKQGAAMPSSTGSGGPRSRPGCSRRPRRAILRRSGPSSPTSPTSTPASIATHTYDYAEAKRLIGADEVSSANLTPAEVPTSWLSADPQPQDAQLVIKRFTGHPGVRSVTAPVQQIHTMEETITVLQWVFLVVAVVLLLSAGVLILNTIRMAIFARRRRSRS